MEKTLNSNKELYIYKGNEEKAATIRIVERILDDKMFKATLKFNELMRGTAL